MTLTRRAAVSGIVSTVALAGCGGEGGTGDGPIAVVPVTPAPAPTPSPAPTPTPTPSAPPLQSRATLSILTLGMSVFLGDDLVGFDNPDRAAIIADNTPTRYFAKALMAARPAGRTIREVNAAVGGSFDDQTPDQYAGAAGKPYDVVILGLGMNSGSAYGVHGRGPNAVFTKERLRTLLREIKTTGAVPIVCNTVHPWPEKTTPVSIRSALSEGIAWPAEQQTLLYGGTLAFDREAGTFGSPLPSEEGRGLFERAGGQSIRAGSKLRIDDRTGLNDGQNAGANAGIIMTVTRRVGGNTVQVEPGSIQESGVFTSVVRHFDPPIDEFLVPPSTQQVQKRDWTGGGVIVDGLASYATWNGILADLAREEDVKLLDFEYRGFKWVEWRGWQSVYTSIYQGVVFETYNHPQWAAQRVVYGDMMTWLAGVLDTNGLSGGFERLIGPPIS